MQYLSKWLKWAYSQIEFWFLFDSVRFWTNRSKSLKWADSQIVFWTLFNSVRFRTNRSKSLKWVDSQIRNLDSFLQSEFGLISPNDYPMRSIEKDNAIEVRSEIIRTA